MAEIVGYKYSHPEHFFRMDILGCPMLTLFPVIAHRIHVYIYHKKSNIHVGKE